MRKPPPDIVLRSDHAWHRRCRDKTAHDEHGTCVILVVTATTVGNRDQVFEAMGHGALDAVNTPVMTRDNGLMCAASDP